MSRQAPTVEQLAVGQSGVGKGPSHDSGGLDTDTATGSGSGPTSAGVAPLLAAALAVSVAGLASVAFGAVEVPVMALVDPSHPLHDVIAARVPRTLLALSVGGALGLAGACLQGMTRNPLADPGLLGVNAGASLAMVLGLSWWGASTLTEFLALAFGGAAVAAVVVHLIAAFGGDGATPLALVIAGAAFSAAVAAWTSAILLVDASTMQSLRLWSVGSVGGRGWEGLTLGTPFLAVGTVIALASARLLDALALGEDLARGLGRQPARDRLVVGAAVVLLAGGATALAGPIGFVGLIVPHAVRALVGPGHRRVLPLSLLGGALLTVVADTVGRVVAPPTEVQVGVMTAVIGVPVFLVLVRRTR